MHPAPSIIVFTVLSGFGFGALFFLGLGLSPTTGFQALFPFAIAGGSAAAGLVASAFHLGHPERAVKAFSQWRSSWLSREGWLASLGLILATVYGGGLVFFDLSLDAVGQTMSAVSVLTVLATSMIYAQLKTVPRWNDFTTPILFLATALIGGSFLVPNPFTPWFLLVFGALQIAVWMRGTGRFAARAHTIGTATGLGSRGLVCAFEPPHTGTNFLLNKMVYLVGRRHVMSLRVIGFTLAVLVPGIALLLLEGTLFQLAALGCHLFGIIVIRWLFFAEAEHVVGLFYGRR